MRWGIRRDTLNSWGCDMASNGLSARTSLETYSIGMKLRELRTRKRLTLARLAAETGLSTALLSKLETDRMIPTLPTLATICHVFGVGLSHFFTEPEKHSVSITRKAHLQGRGLSGENVKRAPLHAPGPGAGIVAEMVEIAPGSVTSMGAAGQRQSWMIYVLTGRLMLETGGAREALETGDCACVESEMAMGWSAADKQPCRILVASPGSGTSEKMKPEAD